MVSQIIIEAARLYNFGDTDSVKKIEAYFAEIARRLYPDRDWTNSPIIFRLADEPYVNASEYPYGKPPVIAISKGVLEFVENEDELAFVIGHELGHERIWICWDLLITN